MDLDLTGLVLPERIEQIESVEDADRSAQFVVEPLERGSGHTLAIQCAVYCSLH